MIIYLHGWNSSALSEKAQQATAYFAERSLPCVAPTLHHRPAQAAKQIQALLDGDDGTHTLIGSSMGGFYATHFCEQNPKYRGILINPAVNLADKLREHLGQEQHNYHNNEKYIFSQAHIDELLAMTPPHITHPHRYWLMAQKGDELLDYREAVNHYQGARHTIEDGGDHSFVDFARHLPAIQAFALNDSATP